MQQSKTPTLQKTNFLRSTFYKASWAPAEKTAADKVTVVFVEATQNLFLITLWEQWFVVFMSLFKIRHGWLYFAFCFSTNRPSLFRLHC